MRRRLQSVLLALILLTMQLFPALNASAQETEVMQEPETAHCCGTDTGLMEEMSSVLLSKKSFEVQQDLGISTYSSKVPHGSLVHLMPSTGEVKMLVLPVAFPDYPEERDNYDAHRLEKLFFADYDPDKTINLQSVRGFYDWTSYGKMKLSGAVLPLYEAPETAEYYKENDKIGAVVSEDMLLQKLYHNIIQEYIDSGVLDLEKYDSNGDGYVDGLTVVPMGPMDTGIWWAQAWSMGSKNNQAFDKTDTKINGFIKVPSKLLYDTMEYDDAKTPIHEIGHLLGLGDNYDNNGLTNVIDYALHEVMNSGIYYNVYYKWLLNWIEPVVLTNENEVHEDDSASMNLYAVDAFPSGEEKPKAVVLIPDPEMLPFTEFFIAEYRAGIHYPGVNNNYFEKNPGIVLWHCNTGLFSGGSAYAKATSYLQPIRKTGSTVKNSYNTGDIYVKGDIFSSDSEPINSNFYNDNYTGAYMEVLDLDSEKATLKVGFRDPDISPPPTIELSEPSLKATKAIRYRLDDVIINASAIYNGELLPEEFFKFDSLLNVDGSDNGPSLARWSAKGNPKEIRISLRSEQEGSYQLTVGAGAASYRGKRSREVVSEVFYVDRTPPEVILSGAVPQTVECGNPYTEVGASVTDNLDPDIIAGKLDGKLSIDSSQVNTAKCGTYTVTYTATDHAGNETTAEREVIVQDTIAPSATVSYSTLSPTSGDVVATITPSEPVTVTNTEKGSLSYTFTENGSFTFEFEDEAGNKGTATATVSNIDKSLPTGTVSYDITNPTNQDVTATLTMDPTITILNNNGSNIYVFTENGSFEFELQNAAGTKGTVAATVTWIDKETPTATITYSPHKLTNQDVTATITPSEEVTITSEGGLSHTFSENGSFTFEFEDKAGNRGSTTATVDWIDKEPPVITPLGANPVTLKLGEVYEEPGAEVTDNQDTEIQSKLEIDASAVNMEKAGTYTVKYSVTDSAGNLAEATRTVKVEKPGTPTPPTPTPPDPPQPVIELPLYRCSQGNLVL